ncbi:MAG: transcription termination/antitermination protein NusA [Chloroflexi bacterium]|nr:transcription termination/antitermination protein NusA [Chloroflexota bacterium]
MKSEFEIAITQLCSDRNVSPEVIIEAIEAALVSAYKRNYGPNQNIRVSVDRHSGQARVYVSRIVVAEVEDEDTQISPEEAGAIDSSAELGDVVEIEVKPRNFGRIAAQTAKQVIMQRIREAERDSVYLEYADRVGELANGVVRNVDARSQNVTITLGKAEALLPRTEQIPGEYYRFNQRLRVYLAEVERTGHGPQVIASRSHKGLLRRLLELEVPEIYNGTVEIKGIAREAGSRSKVAVAALQAGIDPVGSCVGMRGVRIQNIVNELNGEKIDVVPWSEDEETFIANALSPAKVQRVILDHETKKAKVVVPDNALSLAIGKEGQNARLAAKLTGWGVDIRSETEALEDAKRQEEEAREAAIRAQQEEEARRAAAELLAEAEALIEAEEGPVAAVEESVEEQAVEAVEEAAEESIDELAEAPVEEPMAALEPEAPTSEDASLATEAVETEVEDVTEAVEAPAPEEMAEAEEPLADVTAEEPVEEVVEGEPSSEEMEEGPETDVSEESSSDEEEDDDDLDDRRRGAQRRKNRKRILEYDERLGEVVSRRRRKRDEKWRWDEDEF